MFLKENVNLKNVLLISIFLFSCGISIFFSCASKYSAAKNITSKDIDCNIISHQNAMQCCTLPMSDKEGSKNKAVTCSKIIEEVSEYLRQNRKQELFEFCFNSKSNKENNCWDKLHTK